MRLQATREIKAPNLILKSDLFSLNTEVSPNRRGSKPTVSKPLNFIQNLEKKKLQLAGNGGVEDPQLGCTCTHLILVLGYQLFLLFSRILSLLLWYKHPASHPWASGFSSDSLIPQRAPNLLSKGQQRLDEPAKLHLFALCIHLHGPSFWKGSPGLHPGSSCPLPTTHIPSVSCSSGLPSLIVFVTSAPSTILDIPKVFIGAKGK